MSNETSKERRLYLILVAQNAPMQLVSSQNLVEEYLRQLEERRKKNDWTIPFQIRDEDDEGEVTDNVVACYSWSTILGIIQGRTAPKEEVSQ